MQKLKIILNSSGSALIAAVVFAAVFSIITVSTVRLTSHGSDMLKRDNDVIKTYWANESGIRVALRYISRINNPGALNEDISSTVSSIGPINGYNPAVSISSTGTGPFKYSITSSTTLPKTDPAVKNENTIKNVMISTMQRWTYFEKETAFDNNGRPVLWALMIVDGDYHSNEYIYCSQSMTTEAHVKGKTTTSGRIQLPSYTYDRPDYPSPYKLGIRISGDSYNSTLTGLGLANTWLKTRFPDYSRIGTVDTDGMEPDASSFSSAYNITNTGKDIAIKIDNTNFDIYKKDGSGTWQKADSNISIASNPIVKTFSETYVWGTIDGGLTVVTDDGKDLYIGGNISYANTNLNSSDDVLALVSGKNIVIPNSFSCPPANNYSYSFVNSGGTIYGSLYCVNGEFTVSNKSGYSTLKDLKLYGGVLFKTMGSTYSSGVGLQTSWIKDQRLINGTTKAPGIPIAHSKDEELSVGNTVYMNIFTGGSWKNEIKKGS